MEIPQFEGTQSKPLQREIHLSVRPESIDRYGHASFSEHIEMYKRGHEDFLESLGISMDVLENEHGVRTYAHKILNTNYIKPIKLGGQITIKTKVTNIKNKSMTYKQEIYQDNSLVSTGEFLMVFVMAQSEESVLIPPAVKKILQDSSSEDESDPLLI